MNAARHGLLRHPLGWLATGFGSGLSPIAPGTVGSTVALLPWLALRHLPLSTYALVLVAAFVLGVWAAQWVIDRLGTEDPGLVVIDEFVGVWITLFAAPPGWLWTVVGLLLFRLFDIAKPRPVGYIDRHLKGGCGAMADDALAGLFALLALQILARLAALPSA